MSNKTQLRHDFWRQWHALTQEARNAHRWPQHKWVTHRNAMNQLLAPAPCQWLRRLYAFCDKPLVVLAVLANSKRLLPGSRNTYGLPDHGKICTGAEEYEGWGCSTFRLGLENFGIVILEACPKHMADARELFWIRKMRHT